MNYYYLMAQLPSLDGVGDTAPLPITDERFAELCDRFLDEKARRTLHSLTLLPPKTSEKSGSALVEAWNDGERALRLALAKLRAEKQKKSFDTGAAVIPPQAMQAARAAVEEENPLQAEKQLHAYRVALLETLRPMDAFSEDAVYYYALKLRLLSRMRQFDTARGEAAYRKIYHAIMSGERLETTP